MYNSGISISLQGYINLTIVIILRGCMTYLVLAVPNNSVNFISVLFHLCTLPRKNQNAVCWYDDVG